ncbi:hypothetical protein JQC72_16035 [Polycladomyces sp. WAk]|uniref:GPI inositol-deacylase PGAP1-like alpha/beta domain-containing protein n=1 Tax=Polycladomyces zharkentensis TaxID=2807616 RepID=A0ABS2WN49_9BACL|nr:hypothetical protein [Polycladomyces sp. WAk]
MRHRKWFLFAALLMCILLVPGTPAVGKASVPPPVKMGQVNGGDVSTATDPPGTWYLGATPPNADSGKPPIVFVQGLNGTAESWWEDTVYHGRNDMYEDAYHAGYRTAFLQLWDASGNGGASMWDNGQLLAELLRQISQYFGQPVNVVAHSKGGIDAQTALVYYGASPYVGKVITLGSPHHGSHLADLAYSWYAGWLADLLGIKSDGVYVLQTGYMDQFRSDTDGRPEVSRNPFYTAAGTNWGPFPSALWTGGAYLSVHGSNDGLVNVWSTQLPYASHIFTENFDHDLIRTGSASFNRIEPLLRTGKTAMTAEPSAHASATRDAVQTAAAQQVVRGQSLPAGQTVTETVPVESGNGEVVFHVMTGHAGAQVTLESPTGQIYNSQSPQYFTGVDQGIFRNANVSAFRIAQPAVGNWKVSIQNSVDDAYLMAVTYTSASGLQYQIDPVKGKNGVFAVKVTPAAASARWDRWNVRVRVVPPSAQTAAAMNQQRMEMRLVPSRQAGGFVGTLPAFTQTGVYNVTVDVSGWTPDGHPFARTWIESVYVPGKTSSMKR